MKTILEKVQGKSNRVNVESSKKNYFVSVDERLVTYAKASIESDSLEKRESLPAEEERKRA